MPRPEPVEITIKENGDEQHPSWLLIRANHVSGQRDLFDSEITHFHYVQVSISRASRKRDLHRDWIHQEELLIEIDMSQAQWGAFVSSFGSSGVPATLAWFDGKIVPEVVEKDSRLSLSHAEVRDAATEAVKAVQAAQAAVDAAFERNAGKREMRDLLRTLKFATANLPGNLEFAAKSLTEHSEEVVQKARADVEAMVLNAQRQFEIESAQVLYTQVQALPAGSDVS